MWIACGLAVTVVVLVWFGTPAFGEYLSGYVIEKSLSVDNVFVGVKMAASRWYHLPTAVCRSR